MDQKTLVNELAMADLGRRVVECVLKDLRHRVVAIFWMLDADQNRWHLAIASDMVSDLGTRETYLAIAKLLARNKLTELSVTDFKVYPADAPIVADLHTTYFTAGIGLNGPSIILLYLAPTTSKAVADTLTQFRQLIVFIVELKNGNDVDLRHAKSFDELLKKCDVVKVRDAPTKLSEPYGPSGRVRRMVFAKTDGSFFLAKFPSEGRDLLMANWNHFQNTVSPATQLAAIKACEREIGRPQSSVLSYHSENFASYEN